MQILTLIIFSFLSFHTLAIENSCEWDVSLTCNGQYISDSCMRECENGVYTSSGYEELTGVACEPTKCENEQVIQGTCSCNYQKVD